MTTTESRETEGQIPAPVGGRDPGPVGQVPHAPGPQPPKRSGPGILRRRLPIVAVILAIGIGFLVGQSVNSGSSSVQPSLVTPAQLATAAANSGANAVDDRGFSQLENGVQHSHGFQQPIDAATQTELTREMALAQATALRYPTLADAQNAGMRRAGGFSLGLGAHMIDYINAIRYGAGTGPMTDAQIEHPLAWIYDGTKPDSRIAGLFYSANVPDPAGFAGPNDIWHQHTNICITQSATGGVDAPLGADRDATTAQCNAVGGRLIKATGPLLHVWVVPGYEDSQGVFAHLNPAITCNDGTYYTVDISKIGTRASACRDGSE